MQGIERQSDRFAYAPAVAERGIVASAPIPSDAEVADLVRSSGVGIPSGTLNTRSASRRSASLNWTTPADDWIAAYGEQGGFGFSAEITESGGQFKVRISEDGSEVHLETVSGSLEDAKSRADALVDEFDTE